MVSQGISSERKSIYSDIEALQHFGPDIVQAGSGRSCGYYIAHRNFELPELKLLVDSVQSSKFITYRKTATLIRKIAFSTLNTTSRRNASTAGTEHTTSSAPSP